MKGDTTSQQSVHVYSNLKELWRWLITYKGKLFCFFYFNVTKENVGRLWLVQGERWLIWRGEGR